jgi:hypothetical protein
MPRSQPTKRLGERNRFGVLILTMAGEQPPETSYDRLLHVP